MKRSGAAPLGYVYKKSRLVPDKTDRDAQEQFLETYHYIQPV